MEGKYRILNIDGSISSKLYDLIEETSTQRATLRSVGESKEFLVH